MKTKLVCFITFFILTFILACSSGKTDHQEEVLFNVVDSLLSDQPIVQKEAGLLFFAPKGLIEQADTSYLKKTLSDHIPGLQSVYFDIEDSTTMIVSSSQNYEALKSSLSQFQASQFNKDGFMIDQFFIQGDMVNNFKLLLRDMSDLEGEVQVIDYAIPGKVFQKKVGSIESSIGTIRKVNNQSNQ